jgi:hypothetical protein
MKLFFVVLTSLFSLTAHAQWSVDFSRRADQMGQMGKSQVQLSETVTGADVVVTQAPASSGADDKSIFDKLFQPTGPTQEIVVLNTDQGFVPSTVRVREGSQYKITVVNVNEKAKNISFVLDSFSEHHATFYGKLKSFLISPKKEGVYTFVSPETSAQGRLVVHPAFGKDQSSPANTIPELRAPASLVAE